MSNWTIGFITEDKRPTATYRCPWCRTTTHFDLTGNGSVPTANCCTRSEPFPTQLYDHLKKKALFAAEPTEGVTDFSGGNFVGKALRRIHNFVAIKG